MTKDETSEAAESLGIVYVASCSVGCVVATHEVFAASAEKAVKMVLDAGWTFVDGEWRCEGCSS